MLGYLQLIHRYRDRWEEYLANLGSEIVSHNIRSGYGRKGRELELGRAYTLPWKSKALEDIADLTHMSVQDYENELDENIGKPILPVAAFAFHIIALIYLISGLTYLTPGAWISPILFFFVAGGFLVIGILLYLFAI